MSTVVEQQQASPVTIRVRSVLADPAAQIAIAVGGVAVAVGGGLVLATSDHLVASTAQGTTPRSHGPRRGTSPG
jgi:hypothetical protein